MSNSYSMMLILNVFLFGLVYLVEGPWINFHLFEIDISLHRLSLFLTSQNIAHVESVVIEQTIWHSSPVVRRS